MQNNWNIFQLTFLIPLIQVITLSLQFYWSFSSIPSTFVVKSSETCVNQIQRHYQLYCTLLAINALFISNSHNIINFAMDSCLDIQPTFSHKIIPINPEVEQQRCRICYQQSKPLITLCECSGSIAFVHEDCILDWITKKMENAEAVQIPKCQICRTTYSARLKIGRKKICPKLFLRKLKEKKLNEHLYLLFCLIGSILALISISISIFSIIGNLLTYSASGSTENQSSAMLYRNEQGLLLSFFKSIVFPIFFMKGAFIQGKKQLKIIEDSKVQIVEVTLSPKMIIKQ